VTVPLSAGFEVILSELLLPVSPVNPAVRTGGSVSVFPPNSRSATAVLGDENLVSTVGSTYEGGVLEQFDFVVWGSKPLTILL